MATLAVLMVLATNAMAQSIASSTVTIVGGEYDGQTLAGLHVGAAQSYQVAISEHAGSLISAGGDQWYFNETSNLFMDESIVEGTPLPCYIINTPQLSNNSGPLECGAATNDGYLMEGNLGDDGTVFITGVQSWWICGVNATQPYGIIDGTVVGGFTTSEPSGPGVANCSSFDSLKLAVNNGSTTTSTTSTQSSTTSTPTQSTSSPPSTTPTESSQTTTTTVDGRTTLTATATVTSSNAPTSATTAPAQPTFTGAATKHHMSLMGSGLVVLSLLNLFA
ncbi:hypothetical protein PV10_06574 [Exophiala mesophila]|uniref:Uncharacterized protein n=1 Tax=Exophiala mesophila TaxID=212818 RepID=A0A0D1ZZ44_EXOME|nr:uncharacterized protein PV10_06574 [Exophiala mesophila]KIV92108.1 hypothetical protein PV10_06574 [Exophiala mesophila]